ncbi:MAG: hypothetical protein U0L74_07235, partial [Paludibacteraceae bacterium]|nr:hypothetical protein [Paludibacteraceae bacterium]
VPTQNNRILHLVTTILTDLLSSFYAVPYHKDSIFSNLSHRNFTVIRYFNKSLRFYAVGKWSEDLLGSAFIGKIKKTKLLI